MSMGIVLAGAALEYYNYMMFTVMMPLIAPVFSGSDKPLAALTSGYLIIFLAALARPLGGLLMGYIGDKKGRGIALFWSLIVMAVASVSIAFLPSYAQVGMLAPVLLLICRMFQTMSAASELNGSAIFLIESLEGVRKRSTKGLASGLAWSFTVLGMLGGSIASYCSTGANWKTPFLIGGVIGLFAISLRLLPKVDHGSSSSSKSKVEFSFIRSVTSSILIAAGISGMFYYNMIWIVGHLQYKMDSLLVRQFGMYYFAFYSVMLLISGIISDYLKKMYKLMLSSIIILAALALPTLYIQSLSLHFINIMLLALYVGPSHAVLAQLFPREYRYRGVSITYSIGTSLVGGVTPFICNYFSATYKYFPAFWLMFVIVLAFVGIFISRKSLSQGLMN